MAITTGFRGKAGPASCGQAGCVIALVALLTAVLLGLFALLMREFWLERFA